MAYYLRSDNQPQHGGYMISNSSMQGGYLMHSAKGSEWKGPHKYIDKRWIQGAWHYLYEIPKEFAQRTGEAVKDTAEKAANTVKESAQKVQSDVKDLKDYSKKVDERRQRAGEDQEKRASVDEYNRTANKKQNAMKAKQEAETALKDIDERWKKGETVNQQEIHDAKDKKEKAEKAYDDAKNAESRREEAIAKDQATLRETAKEMETAKYKASKALNDIIDGADNISAQGAQWLKNQLESGNKWAMNTLIAIDEKGASAVASGNAFLKKLLGKNKQQASSSSSGRKYSGIGNKAQKHGEAVSGGPVGDPERNKNRSKR